MLSHSLRNCRFGHEKLLAHLPAGDETLNLYIEGFFNMVILNTLSNLSHALCIIILLAQIMQSNTAEINMNDC